MTVRRLRDWACLAILLGLALAAPRARAEGAGAEWLVMVYMAGENNLEPFALDDVNEMERVGSTDQVQVVVLLDRPEKHFTEPGADS